MNQQRFEELVIAWEENQMTSDQMVEFKQLLSTNAEARQRLVETGVLGSVARARVMAWNQAGMGQTSVTSNTQRSAKLDWRIFAVAACIAFVILPFVIRTSSVPATVVAPAEPRYLAHVLSAEAAVWLNGLGPVDVGDNLKESTLELKSGRVELRFMNGALVAIQGPSKFRLVNENIISLMNGRLSADVPPRAVGFTVETPITLVRDLGTRFGVAVEENGTTETHVFEGEVSVTPIRATEAKTNEQRLHAPNGLSIKSDERSLVTIKANPAAFPLPVRVLSAPVPCADFEQEAQGWGANDALPPSKVNVWGGDHIIRVSAERGVQPKSGAGMLNFKAAMHPGQPARTSGSASELFCWIDLRQFRDQFEGRRVTAEFSTWFNRIPTARSASCSPTVIAATFGPGTKPGMQAWQKRLIGNDPGHALSNSDAEIMSDGDLHTWEQATARVTIAPDAELLLLSIRVRNDDSDLDGRRFDDVYADAPALIFRLGDAIDSQTRGFQPKNIRENQQ
jgi:hypothetical protein